MHAHLYFMFITTVFYAKTC